MLVLEVRRAGMPGWALPGTFLHEGERLADAVKRSLRDKAGVHGVTPHQLEVFDDPLRDDRGWVLSAAHWAVVSAEHVASRWESEARLVPADAPGRLIYDHRVIIVKALARIRSSYAERPDPEGLLAGEFTLRELRMLHDVVAGEELDRDWFRRAMTPHLEPTGTMSTGTRGRPAELFRRRDDDDART
ncbi:NUDIX domain-containing protein [Mycolicibacterium sp. P1-18]|uniref:NUDIX hydrolase n=1 Tax=Mycolicibacterium sp. P1-18 TaxID=2024615 RepID=UPI00351AAA4B